ncbi:MAG TPA: ABC-2 family transporter protein [Actinomycetota bacterium]|nr:ABC-2 family transporter protein [Actinomycetota bacterium]
MIVVATMRRAFAEAWARRASFWFQVGVMVANDLFFVAFWFLFFNEVESVRGWDVDDTLLLLAILATVTGVVMGLFPNARLLGQMISDGRVDAALALPGDPLAYLLARSVDAALLGDLLFGPLLFVALGDVTADRVALFLLGSIAGSVVFLSFLVLLGSITFFAGGRGEHAELGFQALLMLSSYPPDIFAGATKLLLFTAVPAAFVSGLPTRLVDDFSPSLAAAIVAVAAAFAAAAYGAFSAGLRRYRSGSAWTQA